jgi:hypothetical protein
MQDAKGHLIPASMVSEIDRERDALVRDISVIAQEWSLELADLKRSIMDDIQAFVELSAEKYDKRLGGKKGNVTLHSFDGRFKVVFSVQDYTVFDERLQIAKEMIDECLREWSADSRPEIKAIVADAFQVDRKGRFNKDRILGLRRLNIEDPKWKKAMEAVADSLQVLDSKEYVRVYRRKDDGSYEQIPLDMASC